MTGEQLPAQAPNPLSAVLLTVGAWLLLSSVFGLVAASGGLTLGLALGTVVGFGVAGTVGARRVPAPADLRMGLRGFAPGLLGILLLMLPAAVLVSEVDNWIAQGLERPANIVKGTPTAEETPGEPAVSGTPEGGDAAPGQEAPGGPVSGLPTDWLTTAEWALFAVALRPVLEEFFFRGVLQQGLVAHLGVARGLLLTVLLFAAVRAGLGLGSSYAFATLGAQALVEGLLLGLIRLASGSILPGILLQGGLAGLGVLGLVLAEEIPIAGFNAEGDHTPLGILLLCGLCVAGGVVLAARAAGRREPLPPAAHQHTD